MKAADEEEAPRARRVSTNDGSLGAPLLGGCGQQPPSSAHSDAGSHVNWSSGGSARNGVRSVSSSESDAPRQTTSSSCWCAWCCCHSVDYGSDERAKRVAKLMEQTSFALEQYGANDPRYIEIRRRLAAAIVATRAPP